MSNITIQWMKTLAKSLRSDTVSHSQALETVAKQHGFKDWNAAAAVLPNETPKQSFDSFVRRIDATVPKWEVIKAIPQYHKSDELTDFLFEIDAVFGDMMVSGSTWDQIAACMRYAAANKGLPLVVRRMPNMLKFLDRFKNNIFEDGDMSAFKKHFPHFVEPKKVPIPYSKLVATTQRIAAQYPWLDYREVEKHVASEFPDGDYNAHSIKQIMQRGPGWKPKGGKKS